MFPALLKMEIKTLNLDALSAREFAITARGLWSPNAQASSARNNPEIQDQLLGLRKKIFYIRSSSIILPGFWCQKALKRRWAFRRRKNPSFLRLPIPAHVTHNTYVCAYVRFLWSWDGFPIFLVASTLELFSLPEGDGWSAVVFCGRSRHPDERNRWRRSLCSFAHNQVDFESCFILVSYRLQFIAN